MNLDKFKKYCSDKNYTSIIFSVSPCDDGDSVSSLIDTVYGDCAFVVSGNFGALQFGGCGHVHGFNLTHK